MDIQVREAFIEHQTHVTITYYTYVIKSIDEERISQSMREKCPVTFEGNYNRLTPAFLRRTLNAKRAWNRAFWVLTENNHQPRLLYPAGLSFTV